MHTRRISPEDHIEQYYWVECTNQFNTKAASHLYFNKYFMFSLWIVLAFIICSGTNTENWSFIFLWSHADTATSKEENSLSTLFLWYKDFRVIFWYKDISDDSEFWQRKSHVASLTVRNVDKIDCLADWTSYHIGKSYTA